MSGLAKKLLTPSLAAALLFYCLASPVLAQEEQIDSSLQQENQLLQRRVRRLEAQVAAMRAELNQPHASQVIGGIGYIVGIFGGVAWYVAVRRKSGRN